MATKRISRLRLIATAVQRVEQEISGYARTGRMASALAAEGYMGGYRDALLDVALLLRGTIPRRSWYWTPDHKE